MTLFCVDRVARSQSLAPLVCVFCVCGFFNQVHAPPLTVIFSGKNITAKIQKGCEYELYLPILDGTTEFGADGPKADHIVQTCSTWESSETFALVNLI